MENKSEKVQAVAQKAEEVVSLNFWQIIYRFLMFCLLVAVIVFDIYFLVETNTDQLFDHFNVAISFFLIPFILAFINNNLVHCKEASQEVVPFNCFFGFFYRCCRIIGFEHFAINLMTPFMGRSTKTLDAKLVEANLYHSVFGSQLVMMTQLHLMFRFVDDDTQLFWIVTPIILHACHIALLGAELRQANKTGFMSFLHTFFHIDFLQNLFEGVGRAILVGATAMVFENKKDFGGDGTLTRQVFAIDALASAGACILVMFYMLIKTGLISSFVYGVSLFFQCLGYRLDSNYMKIYNNFQRRLSNKVTDSQLRFQYFTGIIWRFMEIFGVWAALLDNNDEIYNQLDNEANNRITLRDVLLVGIIFHAIYLAVLLIEFVLYCCVKSKFNPSSAEKHSDKSATQGVTAAPAPAITEEQELVINTHTHKDERVVQSAAPPVEVAEVPVKLPVYINEEAKDFPTRDSKIYQ